MSDGPRTREVARLKGFDFSIEGHGCPVLAGCFDYESGSSQGLGVCVDLEFLFGLMGVFRAGTLQAINGKAAWVTHDWGRVYRIEPLLPDEGEPFDIEEWGPRAQARSTAVHDAGLHPWRSDGKPPLGVPR